MPVPDQDAVAEVRLVTTILERLLTTSSTGQVRNDQLEPLARRLRGVVTALEQSSKRSLCAVANTPTRSPAAEAGSSPSPTQREGTPRCAGKLRSAERRDGLGMRNGKGAAHGSDSTVAATKGPRRQGVKKGLSSSEEMKSGSKPSSVSVLPVPRQAPPTNQLLVSREVARVFASTLYNVLESTATALEATRASVFMKVGDEMVSVVNVSPKLAFPPRLNRHRCQDSVDAEVLGSGVAANQRIHDSSAQSRSVLVFPVYPGGRFRTRRGDAMATVRVENKANGKRFFDAADESFLFFAAAILGEIMSRVPMDWMENFYDPVTQHVIAPFEPCRATSLPLLRCSPPPPLGNENANGAGTDARKWAELADRVDDFAEDVLVSREAGPRGADKATVGGLSVTPSLREVRNYVENVQDSWRRNVNSNVNLMEEGREVQMEMKTMRRELARTQQRLLLCEEQLRLYQLEGSDYKQEYRDMKKELDAYIRNRDDILM